MTLASPPLVDILIVTYNQEKFVATAIESALSQRTSFPFRIIVSDDGSTDQTLGIVRYWERRFSETITVIANPHNVGLVENYRRGFAACSARYLAILEGDDFWHDRSKLQIQVDILEAHVSVGLVHSGYRVLEESKQIFRENNAALVRYCSTSNGLGYRDLLQNNPICAVTVVCRRELLADVDFDWMATSGYRTVDYHLWLQCATKSTIYYVNRCLATYRVSRQSISNDRNFERRAKFVLNHLDVIRYFIKRHPIAEFDFRARSADIHTYLFFLALKGGRFVEAFRYFRLSSFGGAVFVMRQSRLYRKL